MSTDTAGDSAGRKEQLLEQGHSAFDNGDYARALDCYHRACLLDHQDPAVWTALGMALNNLEFQREAWRSYLLALSLSPYDRNTLWYAAEFLAQVEDIELAHTMARLYLAHEPDEERRQEARELIAELRTVASEAGITLAGDREEEIQQIFASTAVPDQARAYMEKGEDDETAEASTEEAVEQEVEHEPTAEEIRLSEEELERQALNAGGFIAPLHLKLSGFEGHCRHCGLQIPADAPYCWSCKMIHFYE